MYVSLFLNKLWKLKCNIKINDAFKDKKKKKDHVTLKRLDLQAWQRGNCPRGPRHPGASKNTGTLFTINFLMDMQWKSSKNIPKTQNKNSDMSQNKQLSETLRWKYIYSSTELQCNFEVFPSCDFTLFIPLH